MLDVLLWLIAIEAVGLVALGPTFIIFSPLKDRGYVFSKPLGLLLIGYAAWLLGTFHILPNVRWSLILLMGLLGLISLVLLRKRWQEIALFLSREKYLLIAIEGLFLLFFFFWVLYRFHDQSINMTEKPMDFALLNASVRASYLPPEDPWLIGHSVSYYYFGYFIMGLLTKLTGISTSVTYNLSLALVPALAAVGVFGLVMNLVWGLKEKLSSAVGIGLVAVFFLLVMGNLEGGFEWAGRVVGWGSPGFWDWLGVKGLQGPIESTTLYPNQFGQDYIWWWRSTRVIDTIVNGQSLDFTITEFPIFSFLLGDLHPHVMSLPFVLLVMGLSLSILQLDMPFSLRWIRTRWPWMLVIGLALGALGFLNTWDLPTFAVLLLGAIGVKGFMSWRSALVMERKEVALWAVLLGIGVMAVAFLAYLPFYLGLSTQASGVSPVGGVTASDGTTHAAVTRPVHFAIILGAFLVVLAPFFCGLLYRVVKRPSLAISLSSLGLALAPLVVWIVAAAASSQADLITGRILHVAPLVALVALPLYGLLQGIRDGEDRAFLFACGAMVLGFLLLMGAELFYVSDLLPRRMNTVFKLYYQAWVLLSVPSAFALYYWVRGWDRTLGWARLANGVWFLFVIALFLVGLYYPVAAAYSKQRAFGVEATTLDGLAYIGTTTQEYKAILWLRRNVEEGGILEAAGESYGGARLDSRHSRISGSTGIPTALGWYGHELQWRGSTRIFDGRVADVADIYTTQDVNRALELLRKYNLEYIYVGPLERERYGELGMEKFSQFMELVFPEEESVPGTVTIYRLRE